MERQDILKQETMKRFHSVPKAKGENSNKPSKEMVEKMARRRRIEIMEEAKEIGCTVEELYKGWR